MDRLSYAKIDLNSKIRIYNQNKERLDDLLEEINELKEEIISENTKEFMEVFCGDPNFIEGLYENAEDYGYFN